jgi:prepilin-type N-terminal cleavage/methylation domain-containing protein
MKIRPETNYARRGFSLLEMMAATTIMALVMGSVVVVVRSSYAVWNAYEQDIDIAENAYAVLRHFVREMRQAQGVTAITAASNSAGSLSFSTAGGAVHALSRNGGSSDITHNNGTTSNLLARSVDAMSFVGYKADGITPTTAVSDIQSVRCTVEVTLPRGGGTPRSMSTIAWVRSW